MSEGKVFGFDKPKVKIHMIGFRLDDLHMAKLTKLFEALDVHPRKDSITARMTLFIDRVASLIVEHEHLRIEHRSNAGKIAAAQSEKEKLANDIEILVAKAMDNFSKEPRQLKPKAQPQPKKPTVPLSIEEPQRIELPPIPLVNAAIVTPIEKDKTILEKHGLVESKTPICARGYKFLSEEQCDACSYHRYCNYSTANKHFISHEAP
jgi:hypothetical protein